MPAAAQAALQKAAKAAAIKAGAIVGSGLVGLVVVPQFVGGFGFFIFITLLGFGIIGSSTILRALNLWNARNATTMARVVGPLVVLEYGTGKSREFFAHLADGVRIRIDADTHRALAYAGELRVEPVRPFSLDDDQYTPEGYLESQYEISASTSTYVPGAALLLQVVNAFGETVFRHDAFAEGDLGPPQSLV